MAIKVIPDGSRKGGGGMDIGKTPKKKPSTTKQQKEGRISDQDIERMASKLASVARGAVSKTYSDRDIARTFSIAKGMLGAAKSRAGKAASKLTKTMKAGGGKIKKKK